MSQNGTDPQKCPCAMFQRVGTCWHRGYRPTFHTPPAPAPPVPRAIERMRQWVDETRRVKWPDTHAD